MRIPRVEKRGQPKGKIPPQIRKLQDIVKRARSGQLLSAEDRAAVAAFTDGPDRITVSSYDQLGQLFGLSRDTIYRIIKQSKDHPLLPRHHASGAHSVALWAKFLSERGKEVKEDGVSIETKQSLEMNRLREQCRKLKLETDILEGKYVLASQVELWASECIAEFRRVLEVLPSSLAMEFAGLQTPAECEALLQQHLDAAFKVLSNGKSK